MFLGTFLSDRLKQDKIIINSELKFRSEILINFPFFRVDLLFLYIISLYFFSFLIISGLFSCFYKLMRINEISLFSFNNHLSRSVGTVYSLYIHSIKLVHTLFTACTYTLYSLHIQSLKLVHTFFTACTMYIHYLQHVQCTYTLFSKYIQSLQLVYRLFTAVYMYSLQLVHTLHTVCTYTLYCLCIHSLEQIHTLYTACTYTPYS